MSPRTTYAPRGLRAFDAAAYLGMSRSKFLELVQSGKLPKPIAIDAMRIWDRVDLDTAFDAIKAEPERSNSFDTILGINK
jgi:predicted DNA-binding transcriptional regulator AlpA